MSGKNAIYTEQEAREKMLCPRTLGATVIAGEANFYPACCQGSACMAWRWAETHINNPDDPKADMIKVGDVYGYCGLAGSPDARRA